MTITDSLVDFSKTIARKGAVSLVPGGIEFRLDTAPQQPCLIEYGYRSSAPVFYAAATWQFPAGYTFSHHDAHQGLEHKLMVIFTENGVGKILVKLRGGGTSPRLTCFFERLDGGPDVVSDVYWPADGLPHRLEFLVERSGAAQDHVMMWLDNDLVMNARARTSGATPSPVTNVQIGAYRNQDCPVAQAFRVIGPVVIGEERAAVAPPPPPEPEFDFNAALAEAHEENERAIAAALKVRAVIEKARKGVRG